MFDTSKEVKVSGAKLFKKCGEIFAVPGQNVYLVACIKCRKPFTFIFDLMRHIQRDHNETSPSSDAINTLRSFTMNAYNQADYPPLQQADKRKQLITLKRDPNKSPTTVIQVGNSSQGASSLVTKTDKIDVKKHEKIVGLSSINTKIDSAKFVKPSNQTTLYIDNQRKFAYFKQNPKEIKISTPQRSGAETPCNTASTNKTNNIVQDTHQLGTGEALKSPTNNINKLKVKQFAIPMKQLDNAKPLDDKFKQPIVSESDTSKPNAAAFQASDTSNTAKQKIASHSLQSRPVEETQNCSSNSNPENSNLTNNHNNSLDSKYVIASNKLSHNKAKVVILKRGFDEPTTSVVQIPGGIESNASRISAVEETQNCSSNSNPENSNLTSNNANESLDSKYVISSNKLSHNKAKVVILKRGVDEPTTSASQISDSIKRIQIGETKITKIDKTGIEQDPPLEQSMITQIRNSNTEKFMTVLKSSNFKNFSRLKHFNRSNLLADNRKELINQKYNLDELIAKSSNTSTPIIKMDNMVRDKSQLSTVMIHIPSINSSKLNMPQLGIASKQLNRNDLLSDNCDQATSFEYAQNKSYRNELQVADIKPSSNDTTKNVTGYISSVTAPPAAQFEVAAKKVIQPRTTLEFLGGDAGESTTSAHSVHSIKIEKIDEIGEEQHFVMVPKPLNETALFADNYEKILIKREPDEFESIEFQDGNCNIAKDMQENSTLVQSPRNNSNAPKLDEPRCVMASKQLNQAKLLTDNSEEPLDFGSALNMPGATAIKALKRKSSLIAATKSTTDESTNDAGQLGSASHKPKINVNTKLNASQFVIASKRIKMCDLVASKKSVQESVKNKTVEAASGESIVDGHPPDIKISEFDDVSNFPSLQRKESGHFEPPGRYKKSHTSSQNINRISCKKCLQSFKSPKGYIKHMKFRHQQVYGCYNCCYTTKIKEKYLEHMRLDLNGKMSCPKL